MWYSEKRNNDCRIIYFWKKKNVTGSVLLYYTFHIIFYYVRRTTTCHKWTHTHTRCLTHTRNQLRQCRTYIYEEIICIHTHVYILRAFYIIYTTACVPAGFSGNYLFTQIDHNYGYYRGDGRWRGHLTPSNPARRRRQIKSVRARARLNTLHTRARAHSLTVRPSNGNRGSAEEASSQFRT